MKVALLQILSLARLRFFLILRQRLGWASLLVGIFLVFVGFLTADVSYVSPSRIFWDFALGFSFVLQMGLALYLGSQLFADEKQRRTLHLLLSSGLSRSSWILGNALGLWLALIAIDLVWFGFSVGVAFLNFGVHDITLQLQVKILQALEILIVIPLALFCSLWVRPLLALVLSLAICLLVHSVDSLQRIFTDPQSGRFMQEHFVSIVIWASKLLPPLDWFNVKDYVGYESQVAWSLVGLLLLVSLVWAFVLSVASWLRFERMDL